MFEVILKTTQQNLELNSKMVKSCCKLMDSISKKVTTSRDSSVR